MNNRQIMELHSGTDLSIDKEGYPSVQCENYFIVSRNNSESSQYEELSTIDSKRDVYSSPIRYRGKKINIDLQHEKSSHHSSGDEDAVNANYILYNKRIVAVDADSYEAITNELDEFFEDLPVHGAMLEPKSFSVKRKKMDKRIQCKKVNINIWEEFYYGESIFSYKENDTAYIPNVLCKFFSKFIPKKILEIFVWTVFFKMCFVFCYSYNAAWNLMLCYLYHCHSIIHNKAKQNIDLNFIGNVFQGPIYLYVRDLWCHYCSHKRMQKVSMRLMQIYRKEHEKLQKSKKE